MSDIEVVREIYKGYEGAYMSIRVVPTGHGRMFAWVKPQREPGPLQVRMTSHLACGLHAGELLEVVRDGERFDSAEAGWIGTHGDGPGFRGLERLTGSGYHMMWLYARQFKDGDELRLCPPASLMQEGRVPGYWEHWAWRALNSHEMDTAQLPDYYPARP